MHASTIGDISRPLLSQRVIEPCKWIGLVLMVVEHASWYVWNVMPGPVMLLGRMVFPLFALALVLGIVGKTRAQRLELVQRLVVWGAIAAGCALAVRDPFPLNVLFTFALGVTLHSVLTSVNASRYVVAAVVLLLGFGVEFGPLGVIGVASLVAWANEQRRWRWLAVGFGCICASNGNLFALGALAVALAIEVGELEVPRIRRLFYWTYAGQWPVYTLGRLL